MARVKGNPWPNVGGYTVATLPTAAQGALAGDVAYATNGRKAAEGAAAGTGNLVFFDGTNWIRADTGATADA